MENNEVGSLPHHIKKNNLKSIKILTVRAKIIKLLEENVEVNLCDLNLAMVS